MRAQHLIAAIAVSFPLWLLAGCNQTPIITPVRSLDRPSDVALTCTIYRPSQAHDASNKSYETGLYEARPLSSCGPLASAQQEQLVNPENTTQIFTPVLRALVANSARGEVAAVDVPNEILVDQDLANPGYNFIPVGRLPQSIRASADGCMAVTANVDSCDLSIVDTTILYNMSFEEIRPIAYSGLGGTPDGGATGTTDGGLPITSQLVGRGYAASVSRQVQLWVGDKQLDARPTAIELTPLIDTDPSSSVKCKNTTYHAWVALPGCQAVVETTMSLGSTDQVIKAQVTQALHVAPEGVTRVDPTTLSCPAECGGASNPTLDNADGGAQIPGGVLPPTSSAPVTITYDTESDTQRLAIGDFYNERVSFITMDPTSGAASLPRSVALEPGAIGVSRVRISPRTPVGKFLYAIARDGSAHVVDLDVEAECETNPDPSLPQFQSIPDVDPSVGARAAGCLPLGRPDTPRRSPNALGPGIYLPAGAFARDVAFVHLDVPVRSGSGIPIDAQPVLLVGDFAWLFGSDGHGSIVNVYDACPQPDNAIATGSDYSDPCDFNRNAPASRAQSYEDNFGNPYPIALERLAHRLRNGSRRFLEPADSQDTAGTPRIQDTTVPLTITVNGSPGIEGNGFRLPTLEPATRKPQSTLVPVGFPDVVSYLQFNDPTQARNETWTLDWEGVLPTTLRAFGRMCGTGDASCPRNAFVDAGAELCDHDVRNGDKLDLIGCQHDSECLYNQKCITDSAPTSTLVTGLCLPRNTQDDDGVEDRYRERCAQLLRAERRYRITDPRQGVQLDSSDVTNVMDLSEIYEPEYAPQTHTCANVDPVAECSDVTVPTPDVNVSRTALPTKCLLDTDGQHRCLRYCDPTGQGAAGACGTGYLCAATTSSNPQNLDYRCMRAPLDLALFTDCVSYPERYQIRAGDAFTVVGSVSGYQFDEVPNPATGVCERPAETNEILRTHNPRIPLDAPMCPDQIDPSTGTDALTWQGFGAPNVCTLETPGTDLLLHFENQILSLALRLPNNPVGVVPADATRITFGVVGGSFPLSVVLAVSNQSPAQSIVSSQVAPDNQSVFVVDEGKATQTSGLRGQLLRLVSFDQFVDPNFAIR